MNNICQIIIFVNRNSIHKMKLSREGIWIYLWPKYQRIDLWLIYLQTICKLFANRDLFAEHWLVGVLVFLLVDLCEKWPMETSVSEWVKNSNCDKTQNYKLWKNSKTQFMKKLINSICDKTQNHQLWQNSKTPIVTKLKNTNFDNWKSQIVTKLKNSNCDKTHKLEFWPN